MEENKKPKKKRDQSAWDQIKQKKPPRCWHTEAAKGQISHSQMRRLPFHHNRWEGKSQCVLRSTLA